MRADAAHPWARFRADQTISLDRPGFRWRATTGPFDLVTVTDALDEAGPSLTVKAFGVIPLARVAADDALTKGELLRYLAELPLAPDAMLRNTALDWEVLGPSTLHVSATVGGVRARIVFTLDADGLVASAFAPDRPRLEGATTVEHPWQGRFGAYRLHHGRRLPFAAEVAWIIEGAVLPVWRGQMEDWTMS